MAGKTPLGGVALLRRLRDRPDSEHEQAIIRVVLVLILLAYFHGTQGGLAGRELAIVLLYPLLSLIYVGWIVVAPGKNPLRRILAMLTDFAAMSLLMIETGEKAALLYPLFLWVTLGNGFRFGVPYLLGSLIVGAASFAVVIAIADPWRDHLGLSLGLLAGLVVVPAYAGTLVRKLTEAKMQAEAASRAKSRFLAIVSHELRTPLNAVIGMADLLDRTKLDTRQREMSDTIRLSGQALLTLIDSVLDFSRIEAGKAAVAFTTVDLHRGLMDLMTVLRPQAEAKSLLMGVTFAADVPSLIRADWPLTRQILTNLIANAVKFTEAGGITIEISRVHIEGRSSLAIEVIDTGIGIPADKLEQIFESFTQADDQINRRYGGTGLGLTIARQLAELLDCKLQVQSRLGEGSTFRLLMPLEAADEDEALPQLMQAVLLGVDNAVAQTMASAGISCRHARTTAEALDLVASAGNSVALLVEAGSFRSVAAEAQDVTLVTIGACDGGLPAPLVRLSAQPSPIEVRRALRACTIFHGGPERQTLELPRLNRLNILLAEDNAINRRVMGLVLEKGGHRFDVVETGDELLEALESRPYDLVITDVNMPGISVVEVVKLYRMAHLGDSDRLAIVACTADATRETRSSCEQAGFDAFLTKPIVAATLLATIGDLARLKQPGRNLGDAKGDAKVADLTMHPGFNGPSASPVDWPAIEGLLELGDIALVDELVSEFLDDAAGLLDAMRAAGAAGETSRFRAECHALKSSAANVGARSVARVCQSAGSIAPGALVSEHDALCRRAREELDDYAQAMQRLLEVRQSSASP